jgi:hypothetical protein
MSLCPPDNKWIANWPARIEVGEVTWYDGPAKEYHHEGKALHVTHSIPHGAGTRQVSATLPISAVLDALLADPEVAEALMVETARAAARRIYA